MVKLLLLDLDGTLLHTDKTISAYTLSVLNQCREQGVKIAVSTARGASNAGPYTAALKPDVLISSGGALVQAGEQILYRCEFSAEETAKMIHTGLNLTHGFCEITVDTIDRHYWNYREDPRILYPDWGDVVHTDYRGFNEPSLKVSVELNDESLAANVAAQARDCDFARFSDGNWYKFTRKSATKSNAIAVISKTFAIPAAEMAAFGDDYVDIEMLRLCGTGVAMGNAIPEVKRIADHVAPSNDEDGVARWIEENLLGGS